LSLPGRITAKPPRLTNRSCTTPLLQLLRPEQTISIGSGTVRAGTDILRSPTSCTKQGISRGLTGTITDSIIGILSLKFPRNRRPGFSRDAAGAAWLSTRNTPLRKRQITSPIPPSISLIKSSEHVWMYSTGLLSIGYRATEMKDPG